MKPGARGLAATGALIATACNLESTGQRAQLSGLPKKQRRSSSRSTVACQAQKLKQQLHITLSHRENETTMDKGGHDIEWLDETDLQTQYEDKPEQLKSVLEKANQREPQTRVVTFYGDITIQTLHAKAFDGGG